MVAHFLRRDLRDFLMWWLVLVATTILLAMKACWFRGRQESLWWLMAYLMFAFSAAPHLLGSVWRGQHQWSRHYLLSLPVSHRRLFAIQHLRILVFWLPLLCFSGSAPAWADLDWGRFTPGDRALYYLGLLASVGLMVEAQIWMTLETERVVLYVSKGRRLWAYVRLLGGMYGPLGLLSLAWHDLLFLRFLSRGSFDRLGVLSVAGFVYRPGIAYAIFPAGCLLAVLWTRHNRRRWCVTF